MGEKESAALPSELLPHVYTFLLQCDFRKVAKALQKAAGESLTTLSDSEPGLFQFYSYYQQRHAGKRTAVVMETGEGEETPPKKKRKRASSGVLDGAMESACPAEGAEPADVNTSCEAAAVESETKKKKKKKRKKSLDASAHEDRDQSAVMECDGEKRVEEEGGGGDEQQEGEGEEERVGLCSKEDALESGGADEEAELGGEEEIKDNDPEPVEEEPEATPTAVPDTTVSSGSKKKKKRQSGGGATPFRRVSDVIDVDPRLQDNSFEAKARSKGSWGEKANKDLKFTKGKSFRHEKTKKKRGTYKGGAIDTSVCSVKFDSD